MITMICEVQEAYILSGLLRLWPAAAAGAVGELLEPHELPDYVRYTPEQAQEVIKLTERKPARVGMLATAERKAAGLPAIEPKRPKGRPPKVPKVAAGRGVVAQPAPSYVSGEFSGMVHSKSVTSIAAGSVVSSMMNEEGEGEGGCMAAGGRSGAGRAGSREGGVVQGLVAVFCRFGRR
jgi:hypothetical protein